jgi:hypothetical protein
MSNIKSSSFFMLVLLIMISCGSNSDFNTPSTYTYSSIKTSGQKTFVVDDSKQLKEIPNDLGSLAVPNRQLISNIEAFKSSYDENIGRFNFFEFRSESIINANITDVSTGSTNDLIASYVRNGTTLIVDGDTNSGLRLSDDFEELYLCNESQLILYRQANGKYVSLSNLEICTDLTHAGSAQTILQTYPSLDIDTLSVTYFDEVFKRK